MTVPTITWAYPEAGDGAVVSIAVSGPLLSSEHGAELRRIAAGAAAHRALVIDLSHVTVINETGLQVLRGVAREAVDAGLRLAFVCVDLILRSELMLADLDTLAPVLDRQEYAANLLRPVA